MPESPAQINANALFHIGEGPSTRAHKETHMAHMAAVPNVTLTHAINFVGATCLVLIVAVFTALAMMVI